MQKQTQFPNPDGTSQAARTQKALDPGYVSVDERSTRDLLVFAKKYAAELRYFNEKNEDNGNWSNFIGQNDLDELAAWLNDPQRLEANPQLSRPHMVLFLIFLELLQSARIQLNDLTRRHLEFYYREALRLTSQKGIPDQVHVLVGLVERQKQFLLPAGTMLKAGQDSLGKDLFYRTDEDLVANRASVESLKSLHAQKMIIGIREARETPDLIAEIFPNNKDLVAQGILSDRTFMAMLSIALGDPVPGSPLPAYSPNLPISVSLLAGLDQLLASVNSKLFMPFSTFRSLMNLKQEQFQMGAQWQKVNDILEKAGKTRDAKFTLDRSQPDNFEKNLLAMLGRPAFGDLFNGLPEVDNIYDLYRRCDNTRKDVLEFIQASLYMSVQEFTTMMSIVEDINGRWRQIYEILRTAARKKQPEIQLPPPTIRTYDADKFNLLVSKTLGTIDYPTIPNLTLASFDDYDREIRKLENYFHVTAEDFVSIRAINQKQQAAHPWEWEQVYAILENAHAEKLIADRKNALKEKRASSGFDAMILFALGDPQPGNPLPDTPRNFKSLNSTQDKNYISEKLFLEPANYDYIINTDAKGSAASAEEWDKAYTMLELAQRRKRGWQVSRAEIEKWDNLYAASDATQIQVQLNADGESTTPRWRTFGDETGSIPGQIGFAIASPLLALSEGARTITLIIGFQDAYFDQASIKLAIQDPTPFRFLLSTEKEMLIVPDQNVALSLLSTPFTFPGAGKPSANALQIQLTLDPQTPPIAPLKNAPLIQTAWPVLQMLLADIPSAHVETEDGEEDADNGPTKRYRAFQALAIEKIQVRVDVSGLTKLTLQNDNGTLDAKKPFEPFGMSPVAGSSFTIAHPELCTKKLTRLSMEIDWLGVPDDLSSYYVGYANYAASDSAPTSPIVDNTAFKANLKLYDNRAFFDVGNLQLFNAAAAKNMGATQTNKISVDAAAITKTYPGYQQNIGLTIAPEALDWSRYWKLELLSPDFQHSLYPRAAAGCANKKPTAYIVNTPYTPKIKRLTMGYSATLGLDLTNTDLSTQADKFYHIEPFGYRDLMLNEANAYPFLPQYQNEGELFIGIKNLNAPQELSLLFQMAEGSADPDAPHENIAWDVLNGNRWQSLQEGQLLSDNTNGLLNAGIIRFSLPAVQPGTLLPSGLFWIRATISSNSRSVGDTVAIQAQAIRATFADQGNALDHLAQPLPAGTIVALAEPLAEVTAISQPYSSFGGKSPELPERFYTRVSERLRHKNRALTIWDYEHIVLEAFPDIYKVKCLPAGVSDDPRLTDTIQIIVIPDIHGKLPFNPFEPKSPADLLLQIEQVLNQHCPPFANFKVKNPTYLRLKVRLGVRLRSDANTGYYKSLLNDELQRYLAPWAYDHSAEIVFGGEINDSLIVNFVEERPYVDYVAGIKLFISPDGVQFKPYDPADKTFTLAPDAIIVSDRSHQIDLIAEEGYEEEFFTGINYMKIELDFEIIAK